MTPLMKWIRNAVEKLFGTFEEGEAAPKRIRLAVTLFATTHPKATIAEWVEFAASHAEESYRAGYVRGYEHTERLGPDWPDPDEAAHAIERVLEVAEGEIAFDPDAVVPLEGVPDEFAQRAVSELEGLRFERQGSRAGPRR
jgi:hypothetical protein